MRVSSSDVCIPDCEVIDALYFCSKQATSTVDLESVMQGSRGAGGGRGPGHPLENCISRSIVVHVEFWYRPPLVPSLVIMVLSRVVHFDISLALMRFNTVIL